MEETKLLNRYSITHTLNNDFYSSLGLASGKMHAIIFFFHCARHSKAPFYEEIANHLLEELLQQISAELPIGLAKGLCGIGWGIAYILQHKFAEGDADEILAEIDARVIHEIYLQQMTELGVDEGILGLAYYILMRIHSTFQTGDTYTSLELKENLIYLIDWIDRKSDEAEEAADDLREWLQEIRQTGFYKTKIDKMLQKIEKTYEKC